MTTPVNTGLTDEDLEAALVAALGRMFPGKDWREVAPSAERAWNSIRWQFPRPWREVCARIELAFRAIEPSQPN